MCTNYNQLNTVDSNSSEGEKSLPAEVELCRLGEWDSFGEAALTEDACRTASCTATSHVEALVLSRSAFEALNQNHEDAGSALAASAENRMSGFMSKDDSRRKAAKRAVLAGDAPKPPPRAKDALSASLRVEENSDDEDYGLDDDKKYEDGAKIDRERSLEIIKAETKDDVEEELHDDNAPLFI